MQLAARLFLLILVPIQISNINHLHFLQEHSLHTIYLLGLLEHVFILVSARVLGIVSSAFANPLITN
jgi:hypothetical protein